MKWYSSLCLCACSIVLAASLMARADQPATQPSDDNGKSEKADAKASKSDRWGFSPYNKLSHVTDEQKLKVNELHRKFLADRKALEEKQEADVMALLTDEQKMELEKMRADEKAKQAERRKASKDKEEEKDK